MNKINNNNFPDQNEFLNTENDIYERKRIVQDVIDRLLDSKFQREYYKDLMILNNIYSIATTTFKGVRIQETTNNSCLNPDEDSQLITSKNSFYFNSNRCELAGKSEVVIRKDEDFSYYDMFEITKTENSEAKMTAELIQDVIDRSIHKEFALNYRKDLEMLNSRYSIPFHLVNGQRVYQNDCPEESIKEKTRVEEPKNCYSEDKKESISASVSTDKSELNELVRLLKEQEPHKTSFASHQKNILDSTIPAPFKKSISNYSSFKNKYLPFMHYNNMLKGLLISNYRELTHELPKVFHKKIRKIKRRVFS